MVSLRDYLGFPQREISLFAASMRMMNHQILFQKDMEKYACTTKYLTVQHLVVGNVEDEMTPNFFMVDFKISAEEMGQFDDGEISFRSNPKEKHNSLL